MSFIWVWEKAEIIYGVQEKVAELVSFQAGLRIDSLTVSE